MAILGGLSHVIDSFRIPGGISVERHSATTPDSDGDPTVGPLQRFNVIPAVVQPATGRDLLRLPEGDRSKGAIIVHTKRRLRTSLESRGLMADEILYTPGGDAEPIRYTVATSGDWSIAGGFYRCIALKKELD